LKRFLSVFLIFILIFNFSFLSFSYADTIEDLTQVGFDEVGSGDTSENYDGEDSMLDEDALKKDAPKSGIFTKIIDWVLSIFEWLNTPLYAIIFALPTLDGIIFNTNPAFKLSFFDEKTSGSVVDSIQGYIGAVYNGFRYLVTAVYIVVLVYLGVRMILSSVGRQKAHYKEMFKYWLIGLLLIFSFHWVMAGIIWLSNEFVDILAGVSTELLSISASDVPGAVKTAAGGFEKASKTPITLYLLTVIAEGSDFPVFGQMLGGILVLVVFGATLVIMFTYLKRLFTIALLILLFPFVALSYVFDKMGDRKSQTLNHWTKEFTINVMMQPIHALLLVLISVIYSTGVANTDSILYGFTIGGAILAPLTLFLIPVGEKLLKQLFQISSSGIGPASTGLGGQMAKAGLGLRGMKELGSTVGKMGKGIMANHNLKKQYNPGANLRAAGKEAYNTALGSITNPTKADKIAARKAQKNAQKNYKNSDSYKAYKRELKEKTGMNSAAGANAKAVATIAGMALGAGTAITSSETLSQLAGGIATNAAIGGSTTGGAFSLTRKGIDAVHGIDGDYTSTLDKLRKANLDATDPETTKLKHKIKADLGIDLSMINNSTKAGLIDDYWALDRYTRFGGKDKDVIASLTSNGRKLQNIDNGLMPDGSGPIDRKLVRFVQDNKNAFFEQLDPIEKDEKGNPKVVARVFAKDRGNSSLKNDEKLSATLEELATAPTEAAIAQYVQSNKTVNRKQEAMLASEGKLAERNATLDTLNNQLGNLEAQLNTQRTQLNAQETNAHFNSDVIADYQAQYNMVNDNYMQEQDTLKAKYDTQYNAAIENHKRLKAKASDPGLFPAQKENYEILAQEELEKAEKLTTDYNTQAKELSEKYEPILKSIQTDIDWVSSQTFTQQEVSATRSAVSNTEEAISTTNKNISNTKTSITKAEEQFQKDVKAYEHAIKDAEEDTYTMYRNASKSAEDLKNVATSPYSHIYTADASTSSSATRNFMTNGSYTEIIAFLNSSGATNATVMIVSTSTGTGLKVTANGNSEEFDGASFSVVCGVSGSSASIVKKDGHWYMA